MSIGLALAAGFGVLALVAAAAVLAIGLWSGRQITFDVLEDKAEFALSSLVAGVSQHLEPVQERLRYVDDAIAHGPPGLVRSAALAELLTGALAATPQLESIEFVDADLRVTRALRGGATADVIEEDGKDDPAARAAIAEFGSAAGATWGAPVWRDRPARALLILRQPVVRPDGRFVGLLTAFVSAAKLSDLAAGLESGSGATAFILYDRRYVLAHPVLSGPLPALSSEHPLPTIAAIGDDVLASIRRRDREPPGGTGGRAVEVGGERFLFVRREITDYGDAPWLVGSYVRAAAAGIEMRGLAWPGVAVVVVVLVAIAAAAVLQRKIVRPIRRLASAAKRISDLDFATVSELPGSRFEEIDDAAGGFNTMLRGLRWFETYVPKPLVSHLMQRAHAHSLESDEREVTVMFTDIAGFTSLSENAPAGDVADFLNHHFALIAKCVDADGGVVDKYIGDSLMAFWGAVRARPGHAGRACRAALDVAAALKADNEERRQRGRPPVHMRIGVHTGTVVVGNIGAPGRFNFTIVGDTVNTAKRIELLCSEVYEGTPETAILISGATAAALGPEFAPVAVGAYQLRGRHDTIEVFRLG